VKGGIFGLLLWDSGEYEMDRDVVSSLRMRRKKDAPHGRLICREMMDRHPLGESLYEL
jgi:hypothetical protein